MTPTTGIEFLLWLLIAASVIAVIATRVRVPYTVALLLGLLGPSLGSMPQHSPELGRFDEAFC